MAVFITRNCHHIPNLILSLCPKCQCSLPWASPYPSIFLPPMALFIAMNCHHIPPSLCPQWQCSLPWPSPSDSSPIPNSRIQPHALPPLSPSLSLSQSQWHYSFARAVLSHLLLPIFNGCMHLHELPISLSPSFSVPNDSIH